MISIEIIEELYNKYREDLLRLKVKQKDMFQKISELGDVMIINDFGKPIRIAKYYNAQMCDIEAEILYMLIREQRPETVVEISPYCGWSST